MRSLFSHMFGKDSAMAARSAEGRDGSGRPELLRRRTLAVNSKIIMVASAHRHAAYDMMLVVTLAYVSEIHHTDRVGKLGDDAL